MPGAIRQRRRGSSCLTLSATAIRNQQSKEVDMGHSLRKFMESVGMPISGPKRQGNHRPGEKHRRGLDILSATGARKESACAREFIASTVDFWIDKDERQTTLWNPTMELGDNFYNLIQVTNMPFNMHHVVQLQRSPRRMDLYHVPVQPHTADPTREAGAYSARRSAADFCSGYSSHHDYFKAMSQARPESNSEGVSKI